MTPDFLRKTTLRRSLCPLVAVAWLALPLPGFALSIDWEEEFADEHVILDGTVATSNDVNVSVTLDWLVVSDNVGDLTPHVSPGYVTAEHGTLGAHAGFIELGFNNQNDDPSDYVELTLTFSETLFGLSFSILDIDSAGGQGGAVLLDDGVQVTYNGGNNLVDNASLYTLPPSNVTTVLIDNEPTFNGFEGRNRRSADPDETTGNVDVDFGNMGVNDITIRYLSTDDAQANPDGQRVGLSDLVWIVPEPSTGILLALGLAVLAGTRQRPHQG